MFVKISGRCGILLSMNEIRGVKKSLLLSALFLMTSAVVGQGAKFQIFTLSGGPVCTWNLRNSGDVDAKVVAVSMRFFHQRPNLDFTPISQTPGFSKNQYQGRFSGKTKTYNYKTVCIFPQDSVLTPAAQIAMVMATNYNVSSGDSILAAGVSVFCKVNGRDTVVEAFPGGVAPCPGRHLFLNGGSASSGLKEGGFGYFNLAAGSCMNRLNMVVYDGSSLRRKAVSGFTPICPNGRKWSSLGFSTDSLVYYSFDISTPAGRLSFDSVVKGMNSGDYAMLGNLTPQPLSYFDTCQSTLQLLGFGNSTLGSTPGYLVMVGKKGLSTGKARFEFCASGHLNCYTSMEQTILSGLPASDIQDFGDCFEAYEQALEKGWPLSRKGSNNSSISVYPNPTDHTWHVTAAGISRLYLTDAAGKLVHTTITRTASGADIQGSDLTPGMYLLQVITAEGRQTTVRLLRY